MIKLTSRQVTLNEDPVALLIYPPRDSPTPSISAWKGEGSEMIGLVTNTTSYRKFKTKSLSNREKLKKI